ncbi:hypothetical protein CspeluHIS016_0400050 [Cutaneotrichosporon spelunceum]|uniref:Uncharacterized protein n=1 Tax=Cutaneotrichosporon spelunceum TaxID=1672016 RepID=A0AAD3YBM7_9TREE|nr:hypothetical protein CspeluHIS016_0400050 [Cutaneotrichosporon spelunceum]
MLRNLFDFQVTRAFPFGRLWNLLTLIFSLLVLAFLVVYATATAGYEAVPRSSPNYNLTQTGWYTVFSPEKDGICDKRLISVGDKLYTTNGVVPWTIMMFRDTDTGESLRGIDYAGETFKSCKMSELVMEFNMEPEGVTLIFSMNCTMTGFEVSMISDLRFPLNVQIAQAAVANVGSTAEKEVSVSWNALFDLSLSFDGVIGLYAAAQNQQNYRTSVSLISNITDWCGIDITSDDLSMCRGSWEEPPATYTRWSALNADLSDRYQQGLPNQLGVPFGNVAIWINQLVFWDVGLASNGNLIRNYAGRAQALDRCANCPAAAAMLGRQPGQLFSGAVLPLTDPGFTPPTNKGFSVQYLCSYRTLKSPANLVQSVLVAVLSLFGAYWTFYRAIWVFWGSHFGQERHKRIFHGEPETPPSSTLGYDPVKGSPPGPVTYGPNPAATQQPAGYFVQQNV